MGPGRQTHLPHGRDGDGEVRRCGHRRLHGDLEIWERRFGVRSTFIPYGAPVLEDTGNDRVLGLGHEPRSYVLVVARLILDNNVDWCSTRSIAWIRAPLR